jgi:hypothetical protein
MPHVLATAALAAAALAAAAGALAIDPGTAKGTLTLGAERIALTHVVAVQRDNAEGLLDRPNEMRLVLADREVKPEALWGIAFLPVTQLAMAGQVRGVLLRWDPANPEGYVLTVLAKPAEPGGMLANTTISRSSGALPGVKIANNRVGGSAELTDPVGNGARWSATFSAPLLHEPRVTDDLRGAAAKASPQVKALQAVQKGLAKGDWGVQRSLSTAAANQRFDAQMAQAGSPDAKQMAEFAKMGSKELAGDLGKVDRVVVRGERAVVLMGKSSWRHFALDGGAWKIDD